MVISMDRKERLRQRAGRVDQGPDVEAIARETEAIDHFRRARDAAITEVRACWGFSRQDAEQLAREVAEGYFDD